MLGPLKRRLGTRRVGHTGTLDRFAQGLMLVLFGQFTRLVPFFESDDKTYEGLAFFGAETDTLDPEGQVIATGSVPDPLALESCLPQFRGDILQIPPEYSALHVDGLRAYERVRRGETLSLPARPVTLYEVQTLDWPKPELWHFRVRCSKGTYIRSLVRDIGRTLGSAAHLVALTRTQVGPFRMGAEEGLQEPDGLIRILNPWELARETGLYQTAMVSEPQRRDLSLGRIPSGLPLPAGKTGLFSEDHRFLALVEHIEGKTRFCFNRSSPNL